jgi:hypothetical protein
MNMDILYLAVAIVFFGLTMGLLRLCEALGAKGEGERS